MVGAPVYISTICLNAAGGIRSMPATFASQKRRRFRPELPPIAAGGWLGSGGLEIKSSRRPERVELVAGSDFLSTGSAGAEPQYLFHLGEA